MGKPLIGLTGRRWPASFLGSNVPPAMSELTFDLHFSDYPRSVAAAGGLPVELTRDGDVAGIVKRIDGLVLSGGADLDPAHYGAEPHSQLGQLERDRDEWEMELLGAAREHVEIDEGVGHPQWDVDGRKPTHEVQVVPNTLTASLLPASWSVNSLHHQTVARVGEGLIISASASDGVVEGFETADGQLLAVQWHPELLEKPDPTFQWLVREAVRRVA